VTWTREDLEQLDRVGAASRAVGLPPKPSHGDERNRSLVTEYGKPTQLLDDQGLVICAGPMSACTTTQLERWCAGCERWVQVNGITGEIRWMAEHRDHG